MSEILLIKYPNNVFSYEKHILATAPLPDNTRCLQTEGTERTLQVFVLLFPDYPLR